MISKDENLTYLKQIQTVFNSLGYNIKFATLLEQYVNSQQSSSTPSTTTTTTNVISNEFKRELAKYLLALIILRTKVTALYTEQTIDGVVTLISPYIQLSNNDNLNDNNNQNASTVATVPSITNSSDAITTVVSNCMGSIPFKVDNYQLLAKLASLNQFGALNTKGLFAIILHSINLTIDLFHSFRIYRDSKLENLHQLISVDSTTTTTTTTTQSSPPQPTTSTSSPLSARKNGSPRSNHLQILTNFQLFSELGTDQLSIHYRPFVNYLFECIKNGDSSEHCYSNTIRPKEQGSFLYDSEVGPIQIGVPPETIKTSLKAHTTVPQIYVLPHILCANGVSYSEVEFPVFFNFFIKAASNPTRRVIMVGQDDQLRRVRAIFKESMFGPNPDQIYIKSEISKARALAGYDIDFEAERSTLAFRKNGQESTIEDFVIFKPFDESNRVKIDLPTTENPDKTSSVVIENLHGLICFYEGENVDQLRGVVDSTMAPLPSALKQATVSSPNRNMSNFALTTPKFIPPTFGITFLGTSHGFDPFGQTTGFIVWINGNGVLVDPPIGTSKYLQNNGLCGTLVESVILTHCHSDHDSGLLQQIVEGTKMTLYTTRTIHDSYMRKAQALTGIEKINEFYNWVPVTIGEIVRIQGADFEFDYSYHTIPTIRFKISFHGKTIAYSSDTKYCPESLGKLVRDGVINPLRESSLRMFVFDSDLIIHECGVPPIHTSAEALNSLPTSIKKKLLVVHTAKLPDHVTDLRIPEVGLDSTIRIDVGDFNEGFSKAVRRFQMLCNSFYFRHMPPSMIYKIFYVMELKKVTAGTVIMRAGDDSDCCYIIESGSADVLIPTPEEMRSIERQGFQCFDSPTLSRGLNKSLSGAAAPVIGVAGIPTSGDQYIGSFSTGDTFGENALSHRAKRSATVIARTDMLLLMISHDAFLKIQKQFRQDELLSSLNLDLERIAMYAPFLKNVLSKTFPFSQLQLTKEQIDHFATTIDSEMVFEEGATIIKEDDLDNSMYIIKEGAVTISKQNKDYKTLSKGECFGEISLILGLPRTCTARASSESPTHLLILKRDGFQRILDRFQNIRFNLIQLVEQRLSESFE